MTPVQDGKDVQHVQAVKECEQLEQRERDSVGGGTVNEQLT